MILLYVLLILCLGAIAALVADQRNPLLPLIIALSTLLLCLLLVLLLVLSPELLGMTAWQSIEGSAGQWLQFVQFPWLPRFGITLLFALDALALLLVGLTVLLGIVACVTAGKEIQQRRGLFYFCLLLTLAGAIGVFTALDLFLFFFFWELMLIPMYFIISIWGEQGRALGALKFFLYTQLSSLLLLVATLMLVYYYSQDGADLSFSYFDLLKASVPDSQRFWVMLAMVLAFMTKSAIFPVHGWLSDAHSQAPSAGSIVLSGVFLNTGAYGFLRFGLPFFPELSWDYASVMIGIGLITMVYGATLAFAQDDAKRVLAYASASLMGLVVMGISVWNTLSVQGALVLMISHGVTTAGLFMLMGALRWRLGSTSMAAMGGFMAVLPRLSWCLTLFMLAALGLPMSSLFVGRLLVLLGAWSTQPVLITLAAFATLLSAAYTLRLIQRTCHGELSLARLDLPDLQWYEVLLLTFLLLLIVYLGIHPQSLLDQLAPVLVALAVHSG